MSNFVVYVDKHDASNSDIKIERCVKDYLKTSKCLPAVIRQNYEKPRFQTDIGVYFSVSHSGDFWVCSVGKKPSGVDLQLVNTEYNRDIAARFFHPDETSYLKRQDFRDFFSVWTAKESYVKFLGTGLSMGLNNFCVVNGNELSNQVNNAQLRFCKFHPQYVMCLCAEKVNNVQIKKLSCVDNK